jgi:hypothetical protein
VVQTFLLERAPGKSARTIGLAHCSVLGFGVVRFYRGYSTAGVAGICRGSASEQGGPRVRRALVCFRRSTRTRAKVNAFAAFTAACYTS